jgi:excisionase family DNA binding protein
MPPTTTLPEDAIGIAAAAQLLGVAPCSVWRWMNAGRLRGWRVGHRWKLSRGEVLSLISCNGPRPEVVERADRERELAEVDRVLREAGVRR